MRISEVAQKLGMTIHTLRYYEKIGLIRNVARKGGKRDYSQFDLLWLEFIQRLKNTNMPLDEIIRYSQLRYAGDQTIPERKAMLLHHRERLRQEIKKLQSYMSTLQAKIKKYDEMEREHESVSKGSSKPQKD